MSGGLFITFEGIDGSGKTTQLNLIKSLLENKGYSCIVTREPGALNFGHKIRDILLNSHEVISDNAEMFLFLADRAQHVESLIKPALASGKIVLCDRYVDSTIAYQGFGRNRDIQLLSKLNNIAVSGLLPDLTLLFDLDLSIALDRIGKTKDRMESEGFEFYSKVKSGYLQLQKEYSERIKLINSNIPIELVYNKTKEIVEDTLKRKLGG